MNRNIVRTGTAIASLALVLAPASVYADVVTKKDVKGDAVAGLDVSKVTYRNGPEVVSTRIVIPHLERRGVAQLAVGQPNSDVGYAALVRVNKDGSLTRRLFYLTNVERRPTKCKVGGQWSAADGVIRISVPHKCLKALSGLKSHYLVASTGHGSDYAPPAAHLRRG